MKRLIMTTLLLAIGPLALAAGTVEETRPFEKDGNLMVINTSGSVEITGWRRNEVEIKAELGEEVEELLIEPEDDDLLVKVVQKKHKKGDHYSYRNSGTKLVIRAPYGANLKVKTVSADVTVKEIRGYQRIRTVSGDLHTNIESDEVELRTVSGDLRVTGNGKASEVELYTVSGTIEASGVGGEVRAEAVSGDIELAGMNVDEAHLKTVSGDLEASLDLTKDASLHMESVSGDIEVNLPRNYAADYELTSFSGRIDDIFGQEARRKSKYAPGSELMYTHGNSKARVRANTLSGDIELEFDL